MSNKGKQAIDFDHFHKLSETLVNELPYTILVGGTNGKGTLSTALSAAFTASGIDNGLLLSPHLVNERERVSVNGVPISQEHLFHTDKRLSTLIGDAPLSYFQRWALRAFSFFASQSLKVVILEVGMGGRLDPSNASNPSLSCITSIGLDHTDILGKTTLEVLKQKLPIARTGKPLLLGSLSSELKSASSQWANDHQVPIFFSNGNGEAFDSVDLWLNRISEHLPHHLRFVGDVLSKLALCAIPGRKHFVGNYLLDSAHNAEAFISLLEVLPSEYDVLVTLPRNRTLSRAFLTLLSHAKRVWIADENYLNEPDYFWQCNELLATLRKERIAARVAKQDDFFRYLEGKEKLVVTGTIRLVGKAYEWLNVDVRPFHFLEQTASPANGNHNVGLFRKLAPSLTHRQFLEYSETAPQAFSSSTSS